MKTEEEDKMSRREVLRVLNFPRWKKVLLFFERPVFSYNDTDLNENIYTRLCKTCRMPFFFKESKKRRHCESIDCASFKKYKKNQ